MHLIADNIAVKKKFKATYRGVWLLYATMGLQDLRLFNTERYTTTVIHSTVGSTATAKGGPRKFGDWFLYSTKKSVN